jgi:hypothetical protein
MNMLLDHGFNVLYILSLFESLSLLLKTFFYYAATHCVTPTAASYVSYFSSVMIPKRPVGVTDVHHLDLYKYTR